MFKWFWTIFSLGAPDISMKSAPSLEKVSSYLDTFTVMVYYPDLDIYAPGRV